MKKPVTLFALLLVVLSSFVQPQAKKINGKVVSFSESFPLEGVRVEVKGRDMVTGTMADGSFSLGIEPKDEFLVVSLAGYKKEEIRIVPDKIDYDIALVQEGQP